MNAHSPIGPAHGLTLAALNGEGILRAVLSLPKADKIDRPAVANLAGRPVKNIGRDLDQLVNAGLLTANHALTPAGIAALDALDRAAGVGDTGAADLRVPVTGLKPNPLNPRKRFEEADIEAMADTILADEDILEPLLVSPPDSDGLRTIWAGERRWRAVRRLAGAGELPEALKAGLPCRERAADPGQALWIAIVENSQRVDLTPWEDAQALAALAKAKDWSARHLAKQIGRAADGSERGVRDVQEKIKVATSASPEAIAAHERGEITWEALRDSIREKRIDAPVQPARPANPHLALFIVEAAMASDDLTGLWDGDLPLEPRRQWPESWVEEPWFTYDFATGVTRLAQISTNWLARIGLGDDPELTQNYYRMAAGHPAAKAGPPWVSSALLRLNPKAPAAVAPAPAPTKPAQPDPALIEADTQDVHVSDAERLILSELSQAAQRGEQGFAPVGKYWLDAHASSLQGKRLIIFKHLGRPYAQVTAAGEAFADHPINGDQPYQTAWLNIDADAPPEQPAQPAADADAGEADTEGEAAAQLLADATVKLAEPSPAFRKIAITQVLESTGLVLPLEPLPDSAGCAVDAKGAEAFTVDVNGDLHDDVARARVLGLIAAVHWACGFGEGTAS